MTFAEKSAWAMVAIVAVGYGWYLATIAGQLEGGSVASVRYQGTAVVAAIAVVILASISHILLAATGRTDSKRAGTDAIKRYARSFGGLVVTAAAVLGMTLAMIEAESFWVANVLLAGLVIAELATAGSEIAIYRRGA